LVLSNISLQPIQALKFADFYQSIESGELVTHARTAGGVVLRSIAVMRAQAVRVCISFAAFVFAVGFPGGVHAIEPLSVPMTSVSSNRLGATSGHTSSADARPNFGSFAGASGFNEMARATRWLPEPQPPRTSNEEFPSPAKLAPATIFSAAEFPLSAQLENQLPNDPPSESAPIRPRVLESPTEDFIPLPEYAEEPEEVLQWPVDAPLGFTGRSGILPFDQQEDSHFVPMEDRWRIGFPEWDRYGRDHPVMDEYPYVEGRIWDPYHQNVLKGDYPILGQHIFLNLTLTDNQIFEGRQVPTPNTPFESTPAPGQEEFFGDPDQYFYNHNLLFTVDVTHGNGAFKPADWRIKLTQAFNLNHLVVDEFAVVNPDVRKGVSRFRQDYALEEWFVESKLADLSPDYDFVSVRAGSQFFNSDFRGFIFSDTNRAVRLFGTRLANRDQFNVAFFDQTEKETNSLLNTFDDRQQNTLIANYYRQDFIWPGYTIQGSYHFNRDQATFKFDRNNFLVRPDAVGVFAPHEVNAHYIGVAGDGHINRFNISHAFYWVLGKDQLNPLSGRPVHINAQMAAVEISYDRDWARFRGSYFFASGDDDIFDAEACGFDSIFDNPNFAGGQFSYWQRQQIRLFGVNLVNRMSLVPDLRSSKFQGQTNFVNPGLHLANAGFDADITPKTKLITNANLLWFDQTEVLEQFVFQSDIDTFIGCDLSAGIEYRPLLNNNVLFVGGISALVPGSGFRDLYNPLAGKVDTLVAAFADFALTY
jgi:hypothetical protein